MLSRSLLYTAITRAKQHVTLVGDAKGLARALRNDAARRNTALVEHLNGTLPEAKVEL
jgi:ATP-dependent exoDNAse (exonuclease V) alpha subunit